MSKDEVTLLQNGYELVIQVGQHRRNIVLPRILVGLSAKVAWLEENSLKLKFEDGTSPSHRGSRARR